MTGYTLTQPEVWQAGPIAYQAAGAATVGWPQVAGAVSTAQVLVSAASGASGAAGSYQQYFPAGFWSKQGQVVKVILHGLVSWVATAGTTITWSMGVTGSVAQGTGTTLTSGTPLFTSPAYVNNSTAQTSIPWHFDLDLLCTKVGVGSAAVSTSILTTGIGGFTAATAANSVWGPVPGSVMTTFDQSINQFIYVAVTFGTNASASNTCTLLSSYIYGMN
jgi:hypothetical protein